MPNQANKTTTEKVHELKERIKKLEHNEKLSAKRNAYRIRYLIGCGYLNLAQKPGGSMDEINKVMNEFLTRDSDRKLFGLQPLDKKSKEKEKA